MTEAEKLARQFHQTYEELAPDFGYETRTETREFDPATPNGQLMIAVCERILISQIIVTCERLVTAFQDEQKVNKNG